VQRRHDYLRVGWTNSEEKLDETRFLEREKRSSLLHGLQSFGGDADRNLLAEFRDEKGLGLEIHLATTLARRVEFGRTDAVGIPAADLRFLACYVTRARHMSGHPIIRSL